MSTLDPVQKRFLHQAGIEVPLICGPMYPCSNPELVAAVSEAGGIGIVQPVSLTYVYGHEFRTGLRLIKRLTSKPFGMNALIEKSSKKYHERMVQWIDIALEEGVRFFITSMGKPDWVVERVHAAGGFVYHDATENKWAEKGLAGGADGLIAVNKRAGGHAGKLSWQELYETFRCYEVPIICAGGIGDEQDFVEAINLGYAGVQMGTRFIATDECKTNLPYKNAIIASSADDIVMTERVSGTPVSVIDTPYIQRLGLKVGPIGRWMLNRSRLKYLARTVYYLKSLWRLKRAVLDKTGRQEFWQAGKSVEHIHSIISAGDVVRRFASAINKRSGN
jgi:nitronate monooxygenase